MKLLQNVSFNEFVGYNLTVRLILTTFHIFVITDDNFFFE